MNLGSGPVGDDAFGQALLARQEGRVGDIVSERDDGLVGLDAFDYFSPPHGPLWGWVLARLGHRIRVALRRDRVRQAEAPTLSVGELTVDFAGRRATRAGREVHLTPTELSLLGAFAANPDRVLTQRFLPTAAFGPSHTDVADSLRTYIKQLRRKIEANPNRPQLIVTAPGVGYQFRTSDLRC